MMLMLVPMVSHDPKHVALHFENLDLGIAIVPLTSCDAYASASGIIWAKSHAVSHFDHLEIRNVMVSLTMTLASCDANVNASSVTQPRCHVVPCFSYLDLHNAVVPLMTFSTSCDVNTGSNSVTWPKRLHYTSFQSSWSKECSNTIDDVISIMWCEWHHMTKKCCTSFQSLT